MKPDQKNLLVRIASALVALPVVGVLVFWREPLGMAALCLVVAVLALREYTAMTMAGRPAAERAGVVVVGVGLYLALYLRPDLGALWFLAATLAVAMLMLVRAVDLPAAGARLYAAEFGVFYVGGLLAALPLLHRSFGPAWAALDHRSYLCQRYRSLLRWPGVGAAQDGADAFARKDCRGRCGRTGGWPDCDIRGRVGFRVGIFAFSGHRLTGWRSA